jgi:hypothetical protein
MKFTGHFTGQLGRIATDLVKVENGRISDNWHIEDNLTLLTQMGIAHVDLLPTPSIAIAGQGCRANTSRQLKAMTSRFKPPIVPAVFFGIVRPTPPYLSLRQRKHRGRPHRIWNFAPDCAAPRAPAGRTGDVLQGVPA